MREFVETGKIEASPEETLPERACVFAKIRVLRTLRATPSFAAESDPALTLSYSTPSTTEQVQHDNDSVVRRETH